MALSPITDEDVRQGLRRYVADFLEPYAHASRSVLIDIAASAASFVEADMREQLVRDVNGVTVPDLLQVALASRLSEEAGGELRWLRSPESVAALERLAEAGLDNNEIATLLDASVSLVTRLAAKTRESRGRDVLRMHHAGMSVKEIASELGLARNRVYEVLDRAGVTPHRKLTYLDAQTRAEIVRLYRAGEKYADIMGQLKVSKSQVTNSLRSAHRAGSLPEYGERAEAERERWRRKRER